MTQKNQRVADYIASRCVEAGAKHVFLVTGGGAMHLNDAFARNKLLTPICFHHEQGAAIAAESYYRVSNRLAVVNVTTGPGGINALNGVFGAYVDSIGMLVVSGQVKRETLAMNYPLPLRQLGDQEVDIVTMARTVVKYATVLQDPQKTKEVLDKAIFLATHGRPGPVWIDVPVDVQSTLIAPDELAGWDIRDTQTLLADNDVSENTKAELAELGKQDIGSIMKQILGQLKNAQRPVILAGTGVRCAAMSDEFLELLEKLKIPVVTGWNAHDLVPNDNPFFAGRPGTVGDRAGNFTVQNADFLLVLGCRLNIRQISYNWCSFASRAWKAMVDVDSAELNKPTLDIDLKVHADLKDFIPAFKAALAGHGPSSQHTAYLHWCLERVKKYPTVLPDYRQQQKTPINPYFFIETLFAGLAADEVVVAGNGSACVIGFQAANLKPGQRLYTNSGDASMGYDLPAALGASIALDGKRIVCLAGDGSLMMNLQELQTAVGYGYPVKVIVLNNRGYHSIRQTQQAYFADNLFGIDADNGVSLPDFVAVAKAFNIRAAKVSSIGDWSRAEVKELMQSNEPALIEVMLDPEQPFSPKLASRKREDGSMVSPALEDMAPFLDRDELARNIVG
ncbi:thiamine pyrophosphate-binding protein [Methylomonas sp. YC3]